MRARNANFDIVYHEVLNLGQRAGKPGVSTALRPLLRRLYHALANQPVVIAETHAAVVAVLQYLTTPDGRTDANCWAVDRFMGADWPQDREGLPDDLEDILADMAGALHDTVMFPEVAENFDSTPEQLFHRATQIALPE